MNMTSGPTPYRRPAEFHQTTEDATGHDAEQAWPPLDGHWEDLTRTAPPLNLELQTAGKDEAECRTRLPPGHVSGPSAAGAE